MEFKLIASRALKHCPSVAGTIDDEDKLFVIGCYQLIDQDEPTVDQESLNGKNKRLGSLILIKDTDIQHQLDCLDGGVFDLAVVRPIDCENESTRIYAAHSNGTIATYNVINNQFIQLFQRVETESSMLCSIAVLDPWAELIAVGDATSKVLVAQGSEVIADCKINKQPDDPIWCIQTIKFNDNNYLLMTGCEDTQLRFSLFQNSTISQPIKTVQDFQAGVTSIALIKNPEKLNGDQEDRRDYMLYVGSYDETIKIFRLKLSLIEGLDCYLELTLMKEVHLEGSGIWKLIPIKCDYGDWPYILIAGMYAGAFVMEKFSLLSTIKLDCDLNGDENQNHLIYGVAGSPNVNRIIVSSFYGKKFYCFDRRTD